MFISRKNRTLFLQPSENMNISYRDFKMKTFMVKSILKRKIHKFWVGVRFDCLQIDFFSILPPLNFERFSLQNFFFLLKTGPRKWSKNRADDCDGADEVLVMLILMMSIAELIGIFILKNWLQRRGKKN